MNLLLLTCANKPEAELIVKELLNKKLIVCAKLTPVSSHFLWKGNLDNSEEILAIMDSHESKFKEVEHVIKSLHSYEQFVLVGFNVNQSANGVTEWLNKELGLL
jgi:periplasmic divalent cation tolerance protein